jgi:hypothetical protein
MSVSTKFERFCSDIRIGDTRANNVSSGSYGRDTDMLTSDVDMLMRLPYSYYETYNSYDGNGQSALLQAVRNSLQKTYSTTHLKGDGQVVVVSFNDDVTFEILPCFNNKDGVSFTYPDTNSGGSWKTTNPVPEIKAIRDGDALWNKNLKRLCRMARAWRYYCSVPIGGLLLDTLAYDFLESWNYKDKSYAYYDWMIRDFLYFLKSRSESQQYWLAPGSGYRVFREGKFEYKALLSYNIAVSAVEHEAAEQDYTATTEWQKIFGSRFKG